MAHSPAMLVIESYCAVHGRLLAFAQKLTDEQLFWQLNPADVSSALLKRPDCTRNDDAEAM
jgi:hypothetical protein